MSRVPRELLAEARSEPNVEIAGNSPERQDLRNQQSTIHGLSEAEGNNQKSPRPLALIAEVTHRCPLHCVYCSNPMELAKKREELPTEVWAKAFREARELGVLHAHLTGGEPVARADIEELVRSASSNGLYTNLITSGIGLKEELLDRLIAAGLDHVQLSFQGAVAENANRISGTRAHLLKVEAARMIREKNVGFTMNVVVHRMNLDGLARIFEMAEELRPDKLEIAHVQYYGWAFKNRAALLPSRSQWEGSRQLIEVWRERLKGRTAVEYVGPDYYAVYPKACMGGWGQKLILIDPSGRVMPCHAAGDIPGLKFEKVGDMPLREIWEDSAAMNAFRGEAWMPEPCRSCERRGTDFGGCRCQAFQLTGDPARTDPVCSLSPDRGLVDEAIRASASEEFVYRW